MTITREVEGNGRRGDEHEPMAKMGKDKEKGQAGFTLVQAGMEGKRWARSKGRRDKMIKINFVLLTGLERYTSGED